MKLVKIRWVFLFCIGIYSAVAQIDSVQQLKIVETSTVRLSQFSSASKLQIIDSAKLNGYSNGNLAELLSTESMVFVKSYGLGSLATSSFRGAGASHTAIVWNGFNIQSPMNGLIDLSLIPANFANEVILQFGSSSALWGSGAVGGSIHIQNKNSFNRGLTISTNTSIGSFSDKQQQLSVELSSKKWISNIKLFYHDAKNDFEYVNRARYNKPVEKQINAELQQYGMLQENYWQINQFQKINTRFWYQFNDRNIPPSMTQNKNVSNQKDEAYRFTTEWQLVKTKHSVNARIAYFDEQLYYNDSMIDLKSKSHSQTIIAEVESKFSFTKIDAVQIGLNSTNSLAFTEKYLQQHQQNRYALFASYKLHSKNYKWNALLNLRQEFIELKAVPFTASFGINGNVLKFFFLKLGISQHYRVPTFNDLYWAQGGNPNLKPESGISEDASIAYKQEFKKISWELEAAVFNRNIDNWIIWLPNTTGIWSPDNVLKVWSRGVEYKLFVHYKTHKWKLSLSGLYNYVLSTNEKQSSLSDASLHKQLIYTPIQTAQANFSIQYKAASISYIQVYTGYRYTSSDNKKYLKPYSIANIQLAYVVPVCNSKIKMYAQLNNIFNEQYEVLAYRAMPLLNYQVGLSFHFNKPNNKSKIPKNENQ